MRGFAFLFAGKNWFNQFVTGQGGVLKEPGKFPGPVISTEVAAGLREIALFRTSELGIELDSEGDISAVRPRESRVADEGPAGIL